MEGDETDGARERFKRTERGGPPSLVLFLRPRLKKANASRTGLRGLRGGLGGPAVWANISGGCIAPRQWLASRLVFVAIEGALASQIGGGFRISFRCSLCLAAD